MTATARKIALASGVLPEFGPETTIAAAVAAGFDGVGLWVEPDKWSPTTTRAIRARLADTPIPVVDVEVVWIRPGPDDADHFRTIDIGAEIGASNVLIVSSDPDFAATASKYRRLCEHAQERGMRAVFEFMPFSSVKNISQASAIVEAAQSPAAALLLDPLHLSRSGGTPADISAVPRTWLSYAQFCDAPPELPDLTDTAAIIAEALDGRRLPGDGSLPLRAFLDALPPELPLSVELRSKALRDAYPDPFERARALANSTRRHLLESARDRK